MTTKVGMVSLGCPKNRVDSEVMLGLLEEAGYQLTPEATEADVLIVNTCGFINSAKQESIDTILEMNQYREKGQLKALVMAGCLSQRYQQTLWDDLPEVDAMVGTGEFHRIVEAVEGALHGTRPHFWGEMPVSGVKTSRKLTTPHYTAYLKIAEGCDHSCSFCAIPQMRGGYRSRPLQDIIGEARQLVASGVRELILVAQDSTIWGHDLYGHPELPRLLYALQEIPDLVFVRIMYSYPTQITPQLVHAMRDLPVVAPYLDMPLQHAHPDLLQKMGRPFRRDKTERVINMIRDAIPDITLRTTFIVGFPGETDEHFETLLEFIQTMQFDHVGVFTYSHEEGTRAEKLGDPVPESVKQRRRREAMLVQRKLVGSVRGRHIGRVVPLLIEEMGDTVSVGRGVMDAPGIDGVTYVKGRYAPGQVIPVRISGTREYDLTAEALM
ncbi:SSU ribosomal protein S12P methylthiotransferase [Sulfobacillus thermosulfidooxidans DSM 9293]|uniref:Ribosomal protein uS12 methylthiotransferase RimO n=1 Tax=Sulfobacillus thermosulfidooxidans (strain DSM 9293 / VKM B-1269 / AT-1) TaxID=929705 RepID=A0A1W1WLE6_SULTA|nr:30S ribosomal protein S12 methylthiotransferase RimO [Sulfobacillus thermosulfidooxidans]SMC07138.1 SSU ribosomal protein S12P methylthiotransferase [Sulfobacillus thermosulfidooxidans DSM 9293]